MDKTAKKLRVAPSIDRLMDGILPSSNEMETSPVVVEKPQDNGSSQIKRSKNTTKPPIRVVDARMSDRFGKLHELTKTEKACYSNAHMIQIAVSDDVCFVLKAMSSHNCPQGLIVSAVMRDFVLNHVEEIKNLLYNPYSKT